MEKTDRQAGAGEIEQPDRRGRAALRLALTVAAVALVLDQASKWAIVEFVMDPPQMIEVTGFFNLADSAITIGVAFLVFDGLFRGRRRSKK